MARPVRQALRADLDTVVAIWVDAFADDPYLRWIQPDDAGWSEFGAEWMTFIAELAFERGHTYLSESGDAAIAWIPPDLSLVGPDDIARGRAIFAAVAGEQRADDAVATILAARGRMLDTPNWTLQYLGVRSGAQGTGVGGRIVRYTLDAVDADALPCSLVSSNPRNVPFYERLGFVVAAEVTVPDGTVTLRPMHRERQP